MSPDSVLHMLQRVLKRAGLPRIRFHDLRHTFATMALQNGVDVKTVSSMLGHYSAGFTLDTYAHVTTDAQLKAAQTMGNILSRAVRRFPLPAPVGVSVWVRKKQYQKNGTYEKQKSSKSDDFEDFWYAVRDSNPRPSGP